jgi:ATP/maltotriose-dependent transcriptional regulator MalT
MAVPRNPKITMPSMSGVADRVRLFRRLDQASRDHAVLWVSASAGSGKTTLAATYLKARRRPCLWYQVDARDADPAAFFYYLREAAHAAARPRNTLPLMTAEYARGLEAYARHFFERLGARLPRGAWLVLDDYQELPDSAPLQRLLPHALSALPHDLRVAVLSRAAPPPTFARLVAGGALAFVSGEELTLTDSEARAVARTRTRGRMAAAAIAELRALTGGWMAGTVLLLESLELALPSGSIAGVCEPQVLFDYFATEIFDRASPAAQRLLLATALLPEVDAGSAEALTGERGAGDILADLVRRNYFTFRLPGPDPHYRYHPLFRAFLVARASRTIEAPRARAIAERAADLLLAAGRPDDAAAILAREGSTERLADLVRAHAPILARQGRLASIETWLAALPRAVVEDDPWLSYWLGARRASAPATARVHFERAYRLFKMRRDVAGMHAAWASLVATFFYVWHEFEGIDPWMAELAELRRAAPSPPSEDLDLQVTFAAVAAYMLRGGPQAEFDPWLERATALAGSGAAAQLQARVALFLVMYWIAWRGDPVRSGEALERARPLGAAPDASPLTTLYVDAAEAFLRGWTGVAGTSLAAVERGLAKAERTGIMVLHPMFATCGMFAALGAGDLETASRYQRLSGEVVGREGTWMQCYYHSIVAWLDLCARDLAGAEAHARAAVAAAGKTGSGVGVVTAALPMASVHVERGDFACALQLLDDAVAWGRANDAVTLLRSALFCMAHAHLAEGRTVEALAPLEEGLRLGRERGLPPTQWACWRRDVIARLAALALEHEIETEAAVGLVRALRLSPPEAAPTAWPYAVRIRVLGTFEVWRGEERLTFSRKVQRRPLELLRTIVALGGAGVREEAVVDALWPEAEGDAGAHALETAAYRLRKLLGDPGALVHRDRRLSLDRTSCWVDALALQDRLGRALDRLDRHALAPAELAREVDAILSLYRGPLVPAVENGSDCGEAMRARLRAYLARFLRLAAARLSAQGDAGGAAGYAERARLADAALVLRA